MQGMEGICACVRAEATGFFMPDIEFMDSTFRAIVVRGYCRFLKEVADVVPAFYEPADFSGAWQILGKKLT